MSPLFSQPVEVMSMLDLLVSLYPGQNFPSPQRYSVFVCACVCVCVHVALPALPSMTLQMSSSAWPKSSF